MNCSARFIILNIFVSFLLLPMDPQNHQINKLKNDLCASFKMLQAAGGMFTCLPQEIAMPFLVALAPEGKNILRATNKTFSILLSRENPQSFMFCKELCATNCDKICLGIKMLDAIERKTSSWNFDHAYATTFLDNSYSIIGEEKKLKFDVSVPCLHIITTPNHVNICPYYIIPSMTRCPSDIKLFLDHITKQELKRLTLPEWLLSFLVQHDDANSLKLICSQKIYSEDTNASKLLQLAIFCGSPKVIPTLIQLYKKSRTQRAVMSFSVGDDRNYLGIFFGFESELEQTQPLKLIISTHHSDLIKKHTTKLNNYYECIRQVCDKEFLKTLVPAVPIIAKEKKTKANCIIN